MKMVFKIVRADTVDPCKIQLPIGTHKFGRGIFLDCEDKRVSRNHGQLDVSDDSVTLKALHQNPCFFIRKGTEQSEILRKDNTTNLSNGDKFGLLPDSYWYELLHCTASPDITSATKEDYSDGTNKADNSINDENNVTNLDNAEMDESAVIDFQLNESVDTEERPESPSLITSNQATEDQNAESATQAYQITTSQANTPSKRLHDPETSGSNDEFKKIKTEPVDTTPSTSDVANMGPSSSDQSVKVEPQSSPVKPPNNHLPTRERCMYGAQCYRRNPQHKATFSHPHDADWGPGERGVCPHGASCARRDPRHWRDHDHPPGTAPPPQQHSPPPGKAKKPQPRRRNSNSNEDDELSPTATNPNLPAKRARKTVQRQGWSDPESEYEEADPFGTDGSEDEWEPNAKGKRQGSLSP